MHWYYTPRVSRLLLVRATASGFETMLESATFVLLETGLRVLVTTTVAGVFMFVIPHSTGIGKTGEAGGDDGEHGSEESGGFHYLYLSLDRS